MLQPLYGLNQPYNAASTPARTPLSSSATFISGQFVKLTNGKIELATAPADGLGSEIVWEPTGVTWGGATPTIMGFIEALTDQYVTASSIIDRSLLVTRNGLLDLAVGATEQAQAVAMAIGAPANGVLHFKRLTA